MGTTTRASAPRRRPLSGLRLVATLPPPAFFGGNNLARARDHIAALRNLGAIVLEFDTAPVYSGDRPRIEQQKKDILAFRADAVVSTPNAGYVVRGGLLPNGNPTEHRRHNLFIDELKLPIVLFWDHGLTQPASYLLQPWPERPGDSRGGALDPLRQLFGHPNIFHLFPDSGHASALTKLGLGSFDDDAWYVQGAGKAFVEAAPAHSGEEFAEDVAFYGNIYLAASKNLPYSTAAGIAELRATASQSCEADWALPAFHAYTNAVAALDQSARAALQLLPDQSFYWRFLFDELTHFMNGRMRLRKLQCCGRPAVYYGNFNDSESSPLMMDHCALRGVLPYDRSLAHAFGRTRVSIDVANACFINGFSVKLVDCFAAGGFALTNRKADVRRAFGPLADEIGFASAAEFAAKVDYFLTHAGRRREVAREIGAMVRRKYTIEAMFSIALPAALERLKVRGGLGR